MHCDVFHIVVYSEGRKLVFMVTQQAFSMIHDSLDILLKKVLCISAQDIFLYA